MTRVVERNTAMLRIDRVWQEHARLLCARSSALARRGRGLLLLVRWAARQYRGNNPDSRCIDVPLGYDRACGTVSMSIRSTSSSQNA
jgi:hypothetical protein